MILGPDDPRALTAGPELEEARVYTERFNLEVLGLKPLTAAEKADNQAQLDAILRLIDEKESR